jgi:hypothetical protein
MTLSNIAASFAQRVKPAVLERRIENWMMRNQGEIAKGRERGFRRTIACSPRKGKEDGLSRRCAAEDRGQMGSCYSKTLHFKAGLRVGHPEKNDQSRACGTSVGNSLQSNSTEKFEEMRGISKTTRIVEPKLSTI